MVKPYNMFLLQKKNYCKNYMYISSKRFGLETNCLHWSPNPYWHNKYKINVLIVC